MTRLFLLTLALILYASLFPWRFHAVPAGVSPLSLVLHSWTLHRPLLSVLADVAVNIVAYVPLGLFGYLSFAPRFAPAAVAISAALVGFGLSLFVEVMQALVPGRNPNGLDVTSNTIGAAVGVGVALLWTRLPHRHAKRPDSVCLIGCWLATALLPFVSRWSGPGIATVWRPLDMLEDYAATLALALLVDAAPASRARKRTVLGALLLIVPLRALVATHSVTLVMIVALALGYATAWVWRLRAGAVGVLLAAAITLHGLAPFHLQSVRQPFSWQPFASTMASDSESGVVVLLGKVFLYGSLVWLLREARLRLATAAVITAGLLAAIEVIQVRLPGRTPEITDPLLALIMAWVLWSLRDAKLPARENGQRSKAGWHPAGLPR